MDDFKKSMFDAYCDEQDAMKKVARPRGTDSAKVIPVICTRAIEGRGIDDDPVKCVVQFWTLNGKLIAKVDEHHLGEFE